MVRGQLYSLPATNYKITMDRELVSCPKGEGQAEVELTPTLETELLPDPDHVYKVDYEALGAATKTTALTIERYPNGTLKAVNAKVQDVTGQVIGNVLKGITSIATLTVSPRLLPDTCNQQTRTAITERDKVVVTLDKLKEALADRERTLAKLEAEAAAGKTHPTGLPNQIVKERAEVENLRRKIATVTDELAPHLEQLRFREVYVWPAKPDAGGQVARQLKASGENISKWFVGEAERDELNARAELLPASDSEELWPMVATSHRAKPTPIAGIVYREPAQGDIVICRIARTETACPDDHSSTDRLLSARVPYAQGGRLGFLPLLNEPFQNNSLSATFAESGMPLKIDYADSAQALAASEAFAASMDQLRLLRSARIEEEQRLLELEAKRAEAETRLLEAEKKRRDAEAALRGGAP